MVTIDTNVGYLFTPNMASLSAEAGLLLLCCKHTTSFPPSFDNSSVPWHAQFLLGMATPG